MRRMGMRGCQQCGGLVRVVLLRPGLRYTDYPEQDGWGLQCTDGDVMTDEDCAILKEKMRLRPYGGLLPKPVSFPQSLWTDCCATRPMFPPFPDPGQQVNLYRAESYSFLSECLRPHLEQPLCNRQGLLHNSHVIMRGFQVTKPLLINANAFHILLDSLSSTLLAGSLKHDDPCGCPSFQWL